MAEILMHLALPGLAQEISKEEYLHRIMFHGYPLIAAKQSLNAALRAGSVKLRDGKVKRLK